MPKFLVYIEETDEEVYVASSPSFPGCVSQGETAEEAIKAFRNAMTGYIASLKRHREPLPDGLEDRIHQVEVVKI